MASNNINNMEVIEINGQQGNAAAECPYCKEKNDGLGAVNHKNAPSPGALIVCLYCQGMSILLEGLMLRKVTDSELDELMISPQWGQIEQLRDALRGVAQQIKKAKGQ